MKKAFLLLCLPLLMGVVLLSQPAAAQAPDSAGSKLKWGNPQALTDSANAPYGASRPKLAVDPTGQKLVVAFNRQMSADLSNNDPWFARSINGGESWFVGQIHTSDANSLQIDLAIDANGTAHAAWREGNGIAYSAESDWGNQPPFILSDLAGVPGANNPVIVASERNGHMTIVWSSGDGVPPNIVYSFSNDYGKTWSFGERLVMDSPASSLFPAAVLDDQDHLHVVWEEHDGKPIAGQAAPSRVYYSQLAAGGWSDPIVISSASNAFNAQRPDILLTPEGLKVSYTVRIDGSIDDPTVVRQWVHLIECEDACDKIENWTSAENPVSGRALESNQTEPYNVVSTLGWRHGCTLVYFHGINPDLENTDERLWGVNSCRDWAENGRDRVTSPDLQSLFPDLQVIQNWRLQMVYQSGSSESENQIYIIGSTPNAYLPLIQRR